MKALSIRQPWAWAIIHARKDVENRTWKRKYRGPLLIHASKTFDHEGYDWIQKNFLAFKFPSKREFELGGIIGRVDFVDIVEESESRWFFGPFGWVFENPKPLPFTLYTGQQQLFEVDWKE